MGRPSVSAHTSWLRCFGFDRRAGHFCSSSLLARGIPFREAARVARDCLWHGVGQPGENHERMEIVRPPPQNAVVQTIQRREGGEEQTLGSVHQICTRTVVGAVVRQRRSVEKLPQTCVRDGVARGWTPWISGFSGLPTRWRARQSLQGARRRTTQSRVQTAGRQSQETQFRRLFLQIEPVRPLELDKEGFLQNLRKARRGAAGGPSGMRTEHLRPLLDNVEDSNKLPEIAQAFAQAQIPDEILSALRVGQLTALGKPNGEVRVIVVGDVVRRLITKTTSDQLMTRFETGTKPFQCALSTRVGCESIAHTVQTATDNDARATVLSKDGVGAFDLISRRATTTALHRMPYGHTILPFVLQFWPPFNKLVGRREWDGP